MARQRARGRTLWSSGTWVRASTRALPPPARRTCAQKRKTPFCALAGGHERYKSLRSIFYSELNGVIIVHDQAAHRCAPSRRTPALLRATCPASVTQAGSGRRSAPASVRRWANEVAARGSFVGRCGEVQAAANPGALPVPTLVVANKADLRGARPLCRPPSPGRGILVKVYQLRSAGPSATHCASLGRPAAFF
jgi:hypothetical protein